MLRERHLYLYRVLWSNAYQREGRRPICDLSQAKLAVALDCTVRTVQRLLADLRQPGPDVRHPGVRPAGLRVAYLTVYPAERRPGGRRGGRGDGGGTLLIGSRYVLNVPLEHVEAVVRGLPSSSRPEVEALVSAISGRLASPEVRAHMPSSYRSDIAEDPVFPAHTEATREAMSLDPIGVEVDRGYQQLPGWPPEPGGAPAATPPPRPGDPGYQRWEEKRRAEIDRLMRERFPEVDEGHQ